MQESFWWLQCSDRYIISLFPHFRTSPPPPPLSPSLISFMVSVDVKHHVYDTVRHSTQSYHINFNKLRLLNVNTQICKWILDFLLNRTQVVKFNSQLPKPLTLSTGAPQGGVVFPQQFTLFTNDCRSTSSSTLIFKSLMIPPLKD